MSSSKVNDAGTLRIMPRPRGVFATNRAIKYMETLARIVISEARGQTMAVGLNYKGAVAKIVLSQNDNVPKSTVDFLLNLWTQVQECAGVYDALPRGRRFDTLKQATDDEDTNPILLKITRLVVEHGWLNLRRRLEKRFQVCINVIKEVIRAYQGTRPKRKQYQPREKLENLRAYEILCSTLKWLLELQSFYRKDPERLTDDDIKTFRWIMYRLDGNLDLLHQSARFKTWAAKEDFPYLSYLRKVSDVYIDLGRLHKAARLPFYRHIVRRRCEIICLSTVSGSRRYVNSAVEPCD